MPRVTLYVKEDDQPIWDAARQKAGDGDSLSALVTEALRLMIASPAHTDPDLTEMRKQTDLLESIKELLTWRFRDDPVNYSMLDQDGNYDPSRKKDW